MGFVVGITVSSAFGIASFLPKLYVGAVAAGMGFAGLITFSLWMLGSHAVFEYDAIGVRSSIWMLLGCSAGISFLALVLFFIFMRSGWVLDFFEEQRLLSEAKAFTQQTYNGKMVEDESDPKSYERLGFWGIAWEVSGNVTCRFLIFFETLVVFPSIGPVGWTDTAVVKDIATVGLRACTTSRISFCMSGRFPIAGFSRPLFAERRAVPIDSRILLEMGHHTPSSFGSDFHSFDDVPWSCRPR